MCSAILGFVLVIIIAAIVFLGFVMAANVLLGILLLLALVRYGNSKKLKASKMQCPNCRSINVHLSTTVTGVDYNSTSNYSSGMRFHSGQSRVKHKRIATCRDCGFTYDYITADEVIQEQNGAKGGVVIFAILFISCLILTMTVFKSDDDKESGTDAKTVTEVSTTTDENSDKKEPVKGVEVTKEGDPIDDFFYELSDDTVKLESCNTKKSVVTIHTSYIIDGKEYKTDISDFQVRDDRVTTLILDEGFTEVKTSIFNCCDVQNVFFPKSMTNVYDYTLSYMNPYDDGETVSIYYAGTQEEWAQIFTEYKRTKVEDAEFGEELGEALADKGNEMMGLKYDSSLFDYYFSASPDDLQ